MRITKIVTLPPPPLHGVHARIFHNACLLREADATFESAQSTLFRWRDKCTLRPGRIVSDQEIIDALRAAFNRPSVNRGLSHLQTKRSSPKRSPWPKASPETRRAAIAGVGGLSELSLSSPTPMLPRGAKTEWILESLFPDDPLLCCGRTQYDFFTIRRSQLRHAAEMAFIVPSPMTKIFGRRKSDGRYSSHTLDNTGPRRFVVIDFDDDAGLDVHAAATVVLSRRHPFPLVMALHSGGKSLHAWFHVADRPESQVRALMQEACVFGGDSRMWSRSQFARMPDGLRDNGKRQTVYYFNPEVL